MRRVMVLMGVAAAAWAGEAAAASASSCLEVSDDFGPPGSVAVAAEPVASGLEVPWSLAFLPDGALLVTERPGRVRLVQHGQVEPRPVLEVPAVASGEGGLMGLALAPDFAESRLFYLYYTAETPDGRQNRIERYRLAADDASAQHDRLIFDGIAAERYHDGGRLRFGPDGMLYVGTGDAGVPARAQDPESPNGKILRLTPDGGIPADNPVPGRPWVVRGVRNVEAFDFLPDGRLVLADHGPSGELGRSGHDEIDVASPGDNLGWPTIYGCQTAPGMVTPILTWRQGVPPGGLVLDTSGRIPAWQGAVVIGTLGSQHLHVVSLEHGALGAHEVYLRGGPPGGLGRLRDVVLSPAGELYVTTSNCDGRGDCPADKDRIVRIVPAPR